MTVILNLKLVTISEYHIKKTFCAKVYTLKWFNEVIAVRKVENTVPWTCIIEDLNGKTFLERFMKKNQISRRMMKKNQISNQIKFRIGSFLSK